MYVSDGHKQPAVLCVLKSGNRFLLLKRAKEPNRGTYSPVGGKIDPHENPTDTVIRETFEETGLSIRNPKYCGLLVETSPTNYNWICFVYLVEIDFVEPPRCNEGELEWIEHSKILDIPTPKTDWNIYQYVLEQRNFMFNAEYDNELNLISMTEEIENKLLVSPQLKNT